jgi:hypothetical protein
MTESTAWKKALREPNAIGWIGFLLLVIAIAIGSLLFGSDRDPGPPQPPIHHVAK